MLHTSCGVAVDIQVVLEDPDGFFIARVDALVRGTTLVQEYDGADHRTPQQLASDLTRDRRLASIDHHRHAYVARDLLRQPWVSCDPWRRRSDDGSAWTRGGICSRRASTARGDELASKRR